MTNADWPEVAVNATPDTVDELEAWLFAAGAVSVTYLDKQDQPILEPAPGEMRLWDAIVLVGLFPQAKSSDELISALHLAAATGAMPVPEFELRVLPDAVWERAWMADYQPMQFGPSLWVCPSHCQPPAPEAVIVKLDPGLAFGTGTHATTAQCLEWLGEKTGSGRQPLLGLSLVDYGCGSGVLAIAAALLGARVIAVDIDEQAIQATRQNAADNGVLDQLQIGLPEIIGEQQVDIVLANILFEPLTSLADRFASMLGAGGQLIMSGILTEQVEPLGMGYNQWFDFDPATARNGWALVTATRRST